MLLLHPRRQLKKKICFFILHIFFCNKIIILVAPYFNKFSHSEDISLIFSQEAANNKLLQVGDALNIFFSCFEIIGIAIKGL